MRKSLKDENLRLARLGLYKNVWGSFIKDVRDFKEGQNRIIGNFLTGNGQKGSNDWKKSSKRD